MYITRTFPSKFVSRKLSELADFMRMLTRYCCRHFDPYIVVAIKFGTSFSLTLASTSRRSHPTCIRRYGQTFLYHAFRKRDLLLLCFTNSNGNRSSLYKISYHPVVTKFGQEHSYNMILKSCQVSSLFDC